MRRLILGVLLAVMCASRAHADSPPTRADLEIVVANKSRRTVNEVYASPAASDDWGADRLEDATIEPGRTARIRLGRSRDCGWDIQVVYNDASREERHGVDVCRQHQLAFDASAATPPPGSDEHPVVIANQDNRPIQQVLVSAAEAGDWGDDRLGDSSVSVGEVATIAYRGGCLVDIRVVFDNRSAEERRGLDICALGGVTIAPGWTTAEPVAIRPAAPDAAWERLGIVVQNHAGHAASELYVFPEHGARGPDLLGPTLLEDGGQVAATVLRPRGACRFAAHVVYGGKVPDQDLADIDLCRDPTLVLPPRS